MIVIFVVAAFLAYAIIRMGAGLIEATIKGAFGLVAVAAGAVFLLLDFVFTKVVPWTGRKVYRTKVTMY